jgi:hypothetical protein
MAHSRSTCGSLDPSKESMPLTYGCTDITPRLCTQRTVVSVRGAVRRKGSQLSAAAIDVHGQLRSVVLPFAVPAVRQPTLFGTPDLAGGPL